jgi:hypothetical protein
MEGMGQMMIINSSEKEIWPLGMCTVALYYGVKCVLHRGGPK